MMGWRFATPQLSHETREFHYADCYDAGLVI
jgi:hypothetical protein